MTPAGSETGLEPMPLGKQPPLTLTLTSDVNGDGDGDGQRALSSRISALRRIGRDRRRFVAVAVNDHDNDNDAAGLSERP
jgi:hypothetical protein